jgi:hypothetical protein
MPHSGARTRGIKDVKYIEVASVTHLRYITGDERREGLIMKEGKDSSTKKGQKRRKRRKEKGEEGGGGKEGKAGTYQITIRASIRTAARTFPWSITTAATAAGPGSQTKPLSAVLSVQSCTRLVIGTQVSQPFTSGDTRQR